MHHQLTNQELARLRYAEALRNASRHVVVDAGPDPRPHLSLARVRAALAGLIAHVPSPRPIVR